MRYTKEMSVKEILQELTRMKSELISMTTSVEAIIKNLVVMEQKGGDGE